MVLETVHDSKVRDYVDVVVGFVLVVPETVFQPTAHNRVVKHNSHVRSGVSDYRVHRNSEKATVVGYGVVSVVFVSQNGGSVTARSSTTFANSNVLNVETLLLPTVSRVDRITTTVDLTTYRYEKNVVS